MQGLDNQSTFKNLIYMYKGSQVCKEEANAVKLCRATPAGNLGEPERCLPAATSFLSCYADLVKHSKAHCSNQFKNAMDCLEKNVATVNGNEESGVCSGSMTSFANCK